MTVKELLVTFLSVAGGGRSSLLGLEQGGYSPHLREGNGPLLGVRFLPIPAGSPVAGNPIVLSVELLYEETVDYSSLLSGETFSVVEGTRVIGQARVQ